jgi:hypothetical protein
MELVSQATRSWLIESETKKTATARSGTLRRIHRNVMTLKTIERENYLAKLEGVAGTAANDSCWTSLTQEFLGLPLDYVPAVQEAVRQGRWRQAKNSRGYVRKVATLEAVKLGIAEAKPDKRVIPIAGARSGYGEAISQEDFLDYLTPQGGTQKRHGVWHAVNDRDYEDRSTKERLLEQLPDDLKAEQVSLMPVSDGDEVWYALASMLGLDWERIAAEANLDKWELVVLRCRLTGTSRERALAEQSSEAERNKVQAAWRRFDRKCKPKLRSVLCRPKS